MLNEFVTSAGQTFLVIDHRGLNAIDGTFLNLAEGETVWAGAYGFTVSYVGGDGNDFVLTFTGVA